MKYVVSAPQDKQHVNFESWNWDKNKKGMKLNSSETPDTGGFILTPPNYDDYLKNCQVF